ncbi:MAG TPA: SBBP repeat-containing protein [Planctomycetota bacterium]
MRRSFSPSFPVLFFGMLLLTAAQTRACPQQAPRANEPALSAPQTSLAFVENRGQWDLPARFAATKGPLTLFCETDALVMRLESGADAAASSGVVVRLTFEGAAESVAIEGVGASTSARHYLRGRDAAAWHTGVPAYDGVRYENLHEGLDLYLREADGRLEYDLLLAPGADLEAFRIHCEGIEGLRIDADGSMVLETALGPILQTAPTTWQVNERGEKVPVACGFRPLANDTFGFVVPQRDPALPLVIDPGLVWSTFFGGGAPDVAFALTLDGAGAPFVAGVSVSPNLPVTAGAYQTASAGAADAYVAHFSADGGTLLWATYLGGSLSDQIDAIALDSNGDVVVAGMTDSPDFPTTAGAYDQTFNSIGVHPDAFAAKLSTDGSTLLWSTFVGGSNGDEAWGLALGGADKVTIVGLTWSDDYPTTAGSFDPTFNGGSLDGFVSRLSADGGTLSWSTYLGGSGAPTSGDHYEGGYAVGIDPTNGDVVVAGSTLSADFPTTAGAFDTTYNGFMDAFVAKLDATGSSLLASTFLGGSDLDEARSLRIGPTGAVTVGGWTASTGFPTTAGALLTALQGGSDGFVTLVDSFLSIGYSTYLGGSDDDNVLALDVDAAGRTTVAGFTDSADFPVTLGAWDTVFNGGPNPGDGFVARLGAGGGTLDYSTFLGGEQIDIVFALEGIGSDGAVVAGTTLSSGFPVRPGSYDTTPNGSADAFVARLDLTPGPSLAQTALQRGAQASFVVSNANPGETVHYVYSLAGTGFGNPIPQLGGMNLDLLSPLKLFGQATANAVGTATLVLTIPAGAPLIPVHTQAAVRRGAGGRSSLKTNTVTTTVLP